MTARVFVRCLWLAAGCAVAGVMAGAARAQPPGEHPVRALVDAAVAGFRADPEEGRRLAEQALERLRERPEADLELRALIALCDYYAERDHAQASALIARGHALLGRVQRAGLRAGLLSCEGEVHEAAGDSAKALATFERAVSTAEAAADAEMLANALYLRGWLRGGVGDYALGLIDLRRSFGLYEQLHMPEHGQTALNGLATVYNRMGDFAQAQHYYEQTLRAQLAAGTHREVVVTQYNLGRTKEKQKHWEAARQDFAQVLELSRRLGYARGEAYALRGLASVDNALGDPRSALRRLDEAIARMAATPDVRLKAHIDVQRGIALRLLKRYGESATALNAALAVFVRSDAPVEIAATHSALAETAADSGDWRSAFDSLRRFHDATAGLHQRQLDQRVTALKVEFDTAAKDKENALLLREKAATEVALEQQRRAGRLQAVAIALASLLAAVLALLALRHHRTSRQMQALALTDELTGLPNRRHLLVRLGELIERPGAPCAVLIADLDHFKSINDDGGHLVGDQVLHAVGQVLRETLRPPMTLGRLGGEEFLVLLPATDLDAARQVGERLREAIAGVDARRWVQGRTLSVSLGVTVALPGIDSVSSVLRRADEALYAAKAAGRNCVRTREPRTVLRPAAAPAEA
jgi:diguanylate cyclase (GGDEF)-like protein